MSFIQSIRTCFTNYFTFSGRAARSEYWWFVLFLILGGIAAGILDGLIFGGHLTTGEGYVSAGSDGPLSGLFSLLTFIPAFAVGWRRMHDTGRSGLFMLFPVLVMAVLVILGMMMGLSTTMFFAAGHMTPAMPPVSGLMMVAMAIGLLVLIASPLLMLWWLTRPSQPGANQYGPAPAGAPVAPAAPPSQGGDAA